MPYITCDGRTYSRYDQSKYVQDCIRKEKALQDALYSACTKDPVCRAERKRQEDFGTGVAIIGLCFAVVMLCALVHTLFKD